MTWREFHKTLDDWGWSTAWYEIAESLCTDLREPARIIGQDRDLWSIRTVQGSALARVPTSRPLPILPVVGDWASVEPGPLEADPWTIHDVFPRRSQLSRGSAGTGHSEQVLAANIDRIWIVHGLDVALNLRRLERYLAVAWESGAIPEIILTKSDLADDVEETKVELMSAAAGINVECVSHQDLDSINLLRDKLHAGTTICLIGPSGVGKSTLVNALSQEQVAKIAEVRHGDRKGRHTTTRRELFRIPGGACLLDTPGIRELRIWVMEEGLSQTFPDIEEIAADCRFRDCRHDSEPGCAVLAAVEDGRLNSERLASYRKLQAEAAHEHRKSDPRARAEALSEWKSIMKSMKRNPKHRDRS